MYHWDVIIYSIASGRQKERKWVINIYSHIRDNLTHKPTGNCFGRVISGVDYWTINSFKQQADDLVQTLVRNTWTDMATRCSLDSVQLKALKWLRFANTPVKVHEGHLMFNGQRVNRHPDQATNLLFDNLSFIYLDEPLRAVPHKAMT